MTQIGPLPAIDDTNHHFWTGGAEGELIYLSRNDTGWRRIRPPPHTHLVLSGHAPSLTSY